MSENVGQGVPEGIQVSPVLIQQQVGETLAQMLMHQVQEAAKFRVGLSTAENLIANLRRNAEELGEELTTLRQVNEGIIQTNGSRQAEIERLSKELDAARGELQDLRERYEPAPTAAFAED